MDDPTRPDIDTEDEYPTAYRHEAFDAGDHAYVEMNP